YTNAECACVHFPHWKLDVMRAKEKHFMYSYSWKERDPSLFFLQVSYISWRRNLWHGATKNETLFHNANSLCSLTTQLDVTS
ncbi:hypothetical protein SK128_027978, partial [Halocaridina rubra]